MFVGALFFSPCLALAQYAFLHDSRLVQLGPVGTEATFSVSVAGLKRTDFPLDVEIVRDGKLSYLTVEKAKFNPLEQPTYDYTIASPSAALVYRFSFRDDNGVVHASDYFGAVQPCLEDTTATFTPPSETTPGAASVETLTLAYKAEELARKLARSTLAEKRLEQISKILRGEK